LSLSSFNFFDGEKKSALFGDTGRNDRTSIPVECGYFGGCLDGFTERNMYIYMISRWLLLLRIYPFDLIVFPPKSVVGSAPYVTRKELQKFTKTKLQKRQLTRVEAKREEDGGIQENTT
jgi:hypothetical protein